MKSNALIMIAGLAAVGYLLMKNTGAASAAVNAEFPGSPGEVYTTVNTSGIIQLVYPFPYIKEFPAGAEVNARGVGWVKITGAVISGRNVVPVKIIATGADDFITSTCYVEQMR